MYNSRGVEAMAEEQNDIIYMIEQFLEGYGYYIKALANIKDKEKAMKKETLHWLFGTRIGKKIA